MTKAKGKKGTSGNSHQGENFKDMVASASLLKVKPFLDQQLRMIAMQLRQEQQSTLRSLYVRTVTLEKLIMDKFDISDDQLSSLVADTEDKSAGLEPADIIEKGDTIRLEVSTKTKDQEEFQGSSRSLVESVMTEPYALGEEIESELIGLKTGEVKEFDFGEDKKMTAKVVISRISRLIPKEKEA